MQQYQMSNHKATKTIRESGMYSSLKPSYWITVETYSKSSKPTDKEFFEIGRQVRLMLNRLGNQSKQHLSAVVLTDTQPNSGKLHAHILLTTEHYDIDVETIQDTWIGVIGRKKFNMRLSLERLMNSGDNLTEHLVTIRDECCKVYHHDEEHMRNALAYALRKHENLTTIYTCPKKGQCKRKPCNMATHQDWERHLNGEKLHLTK